MSRSQQKSSGKPKPTATAMPPQPTAEIAVPQPAVLRVSSEIEPVRRDRLGKQVYDVLLHRIVIGELGEGTRLPSEHALCTSFGVSRPVVRDALEQLRKGGMVASRRGSGTHVTYKPGSDVAPSIEKIDQLLQNLEFRTIIEPEAAYLAALRRTGRDLETILNAVEAFERVAAGDAKTRHYLGCEFHVAIAAASSNVRIHEAVREVEYDVDQSVVLAQHLARFDHQDRREAISGEHREIYELIRAQDAEGARARMRSHLEQARVRMLNRRATAAKM